MTTDLVQERSQNVVSQLPAHVKLVGLLVFVFSVVGVAAGAWWVFACQAVIVLWVLAIGQVSPAVVLRRMTIAIPFVIFALVTPLVALGPRTELLGIAVSAPGLDAALGMIAKIVVALLASIAFSATTGGQELLLAFERLRLPSAFTAIMSFMLRYAVIVIDDINRIRIARESRGGRDSAFSHIKAIGAGVGTLFIRSYERGERVHLAMMARGYSGVFPVAAGRQAAPAEWARAAGPVALAVALSVSSHIVTW
jgi:cobalt/nickel transport system permease protein